jgi:RNA polymerase sigma factor (sigma-70 family)
LTSIVSKKDKNTVISVEPQHAIVPRQRRALAEQHGEWLTEESSGESSAQELSEREIKEASSSDDVFRSFARQIARIKRLSELEEYALGMRVVEHNDNDAKKKLVLHNMRLALKMAHQYRRDWTNLMDLVQEASTGMAIAAKKWDPRIGTRFGTYAAYWIRAQLTKFIMTNARLIHTGNTRAGRKIYGSLPQIRRKLLAEGKKPTAELIAKEVNEDPKEVEQILARLQGREASLSTPIDEDGSVTLEDTIASDFREPEHIVTHNEIERVIKDLIAGFENTITSERDMAIWRENLIASEPVNLVDLGKRYGVSKQRMGQLATRLKRSFRRHIIDRLGPETQLSWLFRED